jgi:UDP-N-acetylmuramoyl-tripeptide--D-alanyl-D-alanine ligase
VTEREKEYTQALLNELLPFLVTQHTGLVDKDSNRFSGWNELRGAGKQVIDSGLWHGKAHENSMIRWWQQWVSKGGTFYSRFDIDGHREGIRPSPYYDGESLLAITKAAKYLGPDYVHLWPIAAGTARSLHQVHVVESLEEDPDSDDTKGVYQWLSMALFELATVTFGDGRGYDLPSSIEETYNAPQLGAWLVKMALWMVDVHKTLQKSLNTGYAYEGIVPAWAWASQDANREDTARKLHCAIEKGLGRLIMWQVGMGEVEKGGEDDEVGEWDGVSGLGGVQNAEKESGLRIDVTQHQMHATILARRLVYPQKGATWPWETTKISKAMARKRRV